MPAVKYEAIYRDLKQSIKAGTWPHTLPPENRLAESYGCSRNTIRRAILQLAEEGYVQSVHGKGVLVLERGHEQAEFTIGGIESMKEAAVRNGLDLRTKVIFFTELRTDAELALLTGFPEGSEIYVVRRVRYLNGEAQILDCNYFLKRIVRGLSPTIAEGSVYEYMERVLGETIVTTQRKYTVERETAMDTDVMDLNGYNCLMVVSNRTFNKDGVLFEFTQSRHRPDRFVFYELAHRKR